MYASDEAREAAIEDGAGRPAGELVADLRAASSRFAERAAALGRGEAWTVEQVWRHGRSRPTSDVPRARLAEVELHHVDLDAGYELMDVPEPVAELLVADALVRLRSGSDVPPFQVRVEGGDPARPAVDTVTVTGTGADLLGWLAGRTDGSALRCDGVLPRLPAWG